MNRHLRTALSLLLCFCILVPSSSLRVTAAEATANGEQTSRTFVDVGSDAWYRDAVYYVLENGIMNGTGEGRFSPEDGMSRAMTAQIIYNLDGRPDASGEAAFTDVGKEAWYFDAVLYVSTGGIMKGMGDGIFAPEVKVSREELLTVLHRYEAARGGDVSVGEDTNILDFEDASIVSSWAMDAVKWGVGSGLILGRESGTGLSLSPDASLTRAELATIMARYLSAMSDTGNTAGGKPWIDSDLKENVSADIVTDPTDDFHLYANKDWILANEIPEGYSSWSRYNERALEVRNQCIELLKDKSIKGHDADLIRTYNSLVLDWEARNRLGVSELTEGFEMLTSAKSLDDITKLLTGKDTVHSFYNLATIGLNTGLEDTKTYIWIVTTPTLLLTDSAEYADRTEYGEMYYGYCKEMFTYMGQKFGMTKEEAEKCFDQAIDLETKLAPEIFTTQEQHADDFYERINNEMSFEEVTSLCKNYPLADIISAGGYKYDSNYLVPAPDYLPLIDTIYTEENFEAIRSLMIVKYALSFITDVDRETYDKFNELVGKYFGIAGTVSDEEMAFDEVLEALPDSMQMVYIGKYGSEEDRQKMRELCQQVIDTYRELLSENDWASDEVKKYALEKLDKMTVNAAYPDKYFDTSEIDIEGCTLLQAQERISANNLKIAMECVGKQVDPEMWALYMSVTECNAFYNLGDNSINMIIGMMGEPFFSSDMSTEELYASIGAFWVGHEISHAFDNTGAQFDAEGHLRDWWTEKDKEEFNKRVQKVNDYLDTIVAFGNHHFIGSNINTEMIADMTGLQCALRMASKIEGFDYKKFFIKYAQMYAAINVYSLELSQLKQDEHPLSYSRTNVPVQQFEEFYEAFGVKEGDNMYLAPEDRLVVW